MSGSHFKGPIFAGGVPLMGPGIPATFGNVYFVDYTSGADGNDGKSMTTAKKTISAAYDATTTNNNDVIVLKAHSAAHVLTDELAVTKNRVHFVGLDASPFPRYMGQRARVTMGVTAGTAIGMIKNTGVGNTFHNIKLSSSDTLSTSVYCVAEAGEYSVWSHCWFEKSTDLDQTGAAEVLCNGDTPLFVGCTFGNGIYTPSVARQNVLFTRETVSGAVTRDAIFKDCIFMARAGATTFVNCRASTNDIERLCLFEGCTFCAVKTSTATQALAFGIASALTDAQIILKDCVVQNITDTAAGSKGVFTNAVTPVATGTETIEVTTT